MADRTVFIHANAKQKLGALVARHALLRNSRAPERFRVQILYAEDFPFLAAHEGRTYLREGKQAIWRNDDLQSFTPIRFAIPALHHQRGRAIVMDPDVFAVGDINDLLDADMQGAAILARRMPDKGHRSGLFASSVMLLDCARLGHWNVEADFESLFERRVDYRDWMWLSKEAPGTVGELASEWNDFDHLGPRTRLLHNTRRRTQPWKTGLPADFTTHGTTAGRRIGGAWRRLVARITGGSSNGYYRTHPDPAQEHLFFSLLRECLDEGTVDDRMLREEIDREHLRADAFRLLGGAGNGPSAAVVA